MNDSGDFTGLEPRHPDDGASDICTLHRGTAPLLVSIPHVGTAIPDELRGRYAERAIAVEDTDWHLDEVYAFVREMGASLLLPRHSRYVIDLNRPPENAPMYPGVNNTELCPTRFFTGDALYRSGEGPPDAEIEARCERYWRPYHRALEAELARIQALHGHVVLFDAHSIKSELPWLFEGRLHDLNLGTADGSSCAPDLRARLAQVLAAQDRYSHVVDGRFKGGHITRHYGRPSAGRHAVQLEMTWRCYMREEPPFEVDAERLAALQPTLRALIATMRDWKPDARA
jgi:N-formylglutamate deformylase